jgi:hypothetical protein
MLPDFRHDHVARCMEQVHLELPISHLHCCRVSSALFRDCDKTRHANTRILETARSTSICTTPTRRRWPPVGLISQTLAGASACSASSLHLLPSIPVCILNCLLDRPDDVWWPTETTWTSGQNATWPYYFVVVPGGTRITGGEPQQNVFNAIRTFSFGRFVTDWPPLWS